LIFLDEFSIDRKIRKKYSWGTKGTEINIRVPNDQPSF